MAQIQFDARTVQPDTGFDTLPAGWYPVMVTASEVKPTKDGSGLMLVVTYTVIDGQYKNRKVFGRFNIQNKNPQAQEIAYKQLSALAHAVGHLVINDSSELHNKPLQIKVKVRPAGKDAQGVDREESNDIVSWKNINEQVGAAPAQAAPAFNPAAIPPQTAAAPQGYQAPAQGQAQTYAPPAAGWQQPNAQPPAAPQWAPQQQQQVAPPQQQQPGWAPPGGAQPWQQQQAPQQQAPVQQPQQQAPAQSAPPPWQQPRT